MLTRILLPRRQAAILGAGLAAGLATRAAATVPAPQIDPATPPSETPGIPVPAAQIDRAIAQLDSLAAKILSRSNVPGMAVAVVRDGKTVYAKGFGVRKAGEAATINPDTVFQLASVSKSIAATVVAHQIGLGGIAWESPVSSHLPWFALSDEWVTQHVTIGDLFAHRSGLPDHAGDDLEDLGYDRRTILQRLKLLPLGAFRISYEYTNFGLTAAAEAVAVAAGSDWETLSETTIYRPLGMSSTSSRFKDFMARSNRAAGHVNVAGKFVAKYQRDPDAESPAGGVSSSVSDMAKWLTMVLQDGRYNGEIIVPADALLPAVTGQVISDHGAAMDARPGLYGFGFNVSTQPSGRVTISHSGAFALGAGTTFTLIPSLGLGIIALSNASPVGAVESLTASFADLVQYGVVTRDWYQGYSHIMAAMMAPVGGLNGKAPPANPSPAAKLQDYVGVYRNDYYGPAEILQNGSDLILKIGPEPQQYKMQHWDGAVFTYTPAGENAPDGSVSAVTFSPAGSARPTSLSIEFYKNSGRGDFIRA